MPEPSETSLAGGLKRSPVQLNDGWRVSEDSLQWMLQRRDSKGGKSDSGWRGRSFVSTTGTYDLPYDFIPDPYSQTTQLHFSSRDNQEVVAREVLTLTDNFRVAIEVWQDDSEFDFVATMPTGAAKELRNPDRIREAVAEANSQFKNAIKYKTAPCLLAIFHDAVDVPEEEVIKSALYGDLSYTFSRDRSQPGKLILEGNGAWNKNKNCTTSAVLYVRNKAEPIIIHNFWADYPLSQGAIRCKEIIVLEDGTFKEIAQRTCIQRAWQVALQRIFD